MGVTAYKKVDGHIAIGDRVDDAVTVKHASELKQRRATLHAVRPTSLSERAGAEVTKEAHRGGSSWAGRGSSPALLFRDSVRRRHATSVGESAPVHHLAPVHDEARPEHERGAHQSNADLNPSEDVRALNAATSTLNTAPVLADVLPLGAEAAQPVKLRSKGVSTSAAREQSSQAGRVDAGRSEDLQVRARYHLSLRGQRLLVILGFVMAIAIGALVGTFLGQGSTEVDQTIMVTVQPGDSLWSIAETLVEPGVDVRSVVDQIASLNDLDDSIISIGQPLLVPAE